MCNETDSIVYAQEAPVELVAEFMMTAEKEIAAFYETVLTRYGWRKGERPRRNWIHAFEAMDWPLTGPSQMPLPIALPSESIRLAKRDVELALKCLGLLRAYDHVRLTRCDKEIAVHAGFVERHAEEDRL